MPSVLGGLLLADRLPDKGRAAAFLEALPGTILVSFIAPELLRNGVAGNCSRPSDSRPDV